MVAVDVWPPFLDWCHGQHIAFKDVEVQARAGRGRCLVAARPFAPGATLIQVPPHAIVAERGDGATYEASQGHLAIAHRLLEEVQLGPASDMAAYVAFALEACGEPPDLGPLLSLPGHAGSMARGRLAYRAQVVDELCAAMPGTSKSLAARVLHAVDSRTLYSPEAKVRALVPIFDLMNHDLWPSARWRMEADRTVTVEASRALEVGEEITITYCDSAGMSLLLTYGFLPSTPGPHRSVELKLSLPRRAVPADGSEASPTVEALIRVLPGGVLHGRSPLQPLLQDCGARCEAARGRPTIAAERLLAKDIVSAAGAERQEWLTVAATTEHPSVRLLAEFSAEILEELILRVSAWLTDRNEQSLMVRLSRGPTQLPDAATSESGDDEEVKEGGE